MKNTNLKHNFYFRLLETLQFVVVLGLVLFML